MYLWDEKEASVLRETESYVWLHQLRIYPRDKTTLWFCVLKGHFQDSRIFDEGKSAPWKPIKPMLNSVCITVISMAPTQQGNEAHG